MVLRDMVKENRTLFLFYFENTKNFWYPHGKRGEDFQRNLSTYTLCLKSPTTTIIIYLNSNKSWGLISQTNWSRYSSTEVYLTSGYSWEASTPNDGSISKLVWSPFTKTEWLIDNITLIGIGASANVPRSKTYLISQCFAPCQC